MLELDKDEGLMHLVRRRYALWLAIPIWILLSLVIVGIYFLVPLILLGLIIYVAVHFIVRYW